MTRRRPRLLILAQIPPPVHGQSLMVGHLVKKAKETAADSIIHINLRLSKDELDVGTPRPVKLLLLAWHALRALCACLLCGARDIYYVPAPGKRSPMIRDVLLLGLLKPFARHLILHWHAVGLGTYLQGHQDNPWSRRLSKLLQRHHLSICLTDSAANDIKSLQPQNTAIIPNGIPDPCPDFPTLLASRRERLAQRRHAIAKTPPEPVVVRLLYLGLCIRSKGIFRALQTAAAVACQLNQGGPVFQIILTIAGTFPNPGEYREFQNETQRILQNLPGQILPLFTVETPGFSTSQDKVERLSRADVFLFPSHYENEWQPLTILEALAFGLPVVSTRWRGIPDIFPADYPFLTSPEGGPEPAGKVLEALTYGDFEGLRRQFEETFSLDRHLDRMFGVLDID